MLLSHCLKSAPFSQVGGDNGSVAEQLQLLNKIQLQETQKASLEKENQDLKVRVLALETQIHSLQHQQVRKLFSLWKDMTHPLSLPRNLDIPSR